VPASAINKEIDICKYLADRCFKTSNFVNSINNTKIIIYRDMNITLQKYIEGKTYKIHAAPRWLFLESACLLGKLHIILSNYTVIQNRFGGDWPNCNDYDKAIKEHTEIREKALSSYNVYTNQIISDMNYKIQVLNELHSNIVINKSKLTYANTHGDYCLQQIIARNPGDISLIDFSSLDNLPIIWELLRSYSHADSFCINGQINLNNLGMYIDSYEKNITLSSYDRENLFIFYTVQLLLSSAGYKEYFYGGTRSKEDMLIFGFWRTKMLTFLLGNIQSLKI
jgi:hypothetical protein